MTANSAFLMSREGGERKKTKRIQPFKTRESHNSALLSITHIFNFCELYKETLTQELRRHLYFFYLYLIRLDSALMRSAGLQCFQLSRAAGPTAIKQRCRFTHASSKPTITQPNEHPRSTQVEFLIHFCSGSSVKP